MVELCIACHFPNLENFQQCKHRKIIKYRSLLIYFLIGKLRKRFVRQYWVQTIRLVARVLRKYSFVVLKFQRTRHRPGVKKINSKLNLPKIWGVFCPY
ncbi:unnamed protein product [Acanthoscelides obtectus]|uniref:Uncharacterized protein n=1 Tax=Acanthoscelides obtectus TaxID=200917 RepID=A0A9P0JMX7_ACAOB|nr:unnamed protein product [Acanthoscelides obtectus]CAK1662065.1 hypothetical protein AOBTE_LOCUS22955 [Acanthoscelides obtectus]